MTLPTVVLWRLTRLSLPEALLSSAIVLWLGIVLAYGVAWIALRLRK